MILIAIEDLNSCPVSVYMKQLKLDYVIHEYTKLPTGGSGYALIVRKDEFDLWDLRHRFDDDLWANQEFIGKSWSKLLYMYRHQDDLIPIFETYNLLQEEGWA